MDVSLDHVRAHYDRHAGSGAQGSAVALQRRAEGPSLPLKKFHNSIKRRLISKFARRGGTLLDLACGRGGDVLKWFDAGLRECLGIDLSPDAVDEARRRYGEALERVRAPRGYGRGVCGTRPPPSCEFLSTNALGCRPWRDPKGRRFNLVTCMFALQFFFKSEECLRLFLHTVSEHLEVGGYFIGVAPDGDRVIEYIASSGGDGRSYASPMLTLDLARDTNLRPHVKYGRAYSCVIGDTVTAPLDEGCPPPLEYMVDRTVLEAEARCHGLEPVLEFGGSLASSFQEGPDAHFKPTFVGSDPSLERASALNFAFVFKKVAASTM